MLRAKGIVGAVLYIQYQNKIQIILYIQDPISWAEISGYVDLICRYVSLSYCS